MESRLIKKIDQYVFDFKNNLRDKIIELGMDLNSESTGCNAFMDYMYNYDKLSLDADDFQKRKRVKNFVPLAERCCAKRSNDQQCTRRKKVDCEFCGTHQKGTPHGIMDASSLQSSSSTAANNVRKVTVFTQDIQGIIYYLDNDGNIYQTEDIISNKHNPAIIAKYVKRNDVYTITEFLPKKRMLV